MLGAVYKYLHRYVSLSIPASERVLICDLVIGLALVPTFLLYEWKVPAHPTVPFELLSNRTSGIGYLSVFFHGILVLAALYFLPRQFIKCICISLLTTLQSTFKQSRINYPFNQGSASLRVSQTYPQQSALVDLLV